MEFTKYLMVAGICSVMGVQTVTAQDGGTMNTPSTGYSTRDMVYRGQNYDVYDSSLIAGRKMDQFRRYMDHQYAFPPKPRNQVEIGINVGQYNIFGDVPTLMAWQKPNSEEVVGSYGFGAHIRKALGYSFSLRASYLYGIGKGLSWQPAQGPELTVNPAYNGTNTGGTGAQGAGTNFYNYRTEAHHVNIDIIANLSNILFHQAKPKVNFYVFAGIGAIASGTRLDVLNDANGFTPHAGAIAADPTIQKYSNNQNGGYSYENRNDVRDALTKIFDGKYETDADNNSTRASDIIPNKTIMGLFQGGLGMSFRVSRALNISIEERLMKPYGVQADLLDGVRFRSIGNNPVFTQDFDGINYLSLGFNFNLGNRRKSVEPLYWMNPLDHAYNELGNPRHMQLPDAVLTDSDGDGIADQLDRCPGTPAGVAVDSHGCPMDTDGDGVPDDRDKQLITPTECQPVDADGVGKCPCNCDGQTVSACGNIGAGSLSFSSGSARLSAAMQSQLSNLAAQMQAQPTCKVVMMGGGSGSKVMQQRSWDRVNAVIEYMSEKSGIDRGRFIFQYGTTGNDNAVMYRSANAGEEGPSNVAPPFPNLRRD